MGVVVKDKLVSVVVRTRDRAEMLGNALESIANQIYRNVEVLVVNDAGVNAKHVVAGYDSRIPSLEYHHLERETGRGAALNHGIDRTRGDYLAFLDDDDWWEPEHIANLVNALDGEGMLVAYSGTRAVEVTESEYREIRVFNDEFDRNRLFYQNYIPINSIMIAREIFDRGCRFNTELDVLEDWDFWITLLEQTILFKHVPTITANYRVHEGQSFGLNGDDETVRRYIYCRGARMWGDDEVDDLLTRLLRLSESVHSSDK